MSKIMLIDGNSLLHRAFHALPPLMTSRGVHTNAVYGFCNMLFKATKQYEPDYIAVAFDKRGPTFRHETFAAYKATRPKMPDELAEQFDILKEILKALHIGYLEMEGFEADDVLGTISRRAEDAGIFSLIVTGDRDALQLVSSGTHVMLTKKGITEMETYDAAKVKERYGILPEYIPDLKGLMGDASDNIPGVPGIGEKTACRLLKEYNTVENLLKNIDNFKGKLKETLEKYSEQAITSKNLATIMRDVPLDFQFDDFLKREPDFEKLAKLFRELEFYSLMNKIERPTVEKGITDEKSHVEKKESDFYSVMEEVKSSKIVCLLVYTTESFTSSMAKAIYLACGERFYYAPLEMFSTDFRLGAELKNVLEDPDILKVTHDAKLARNSLRKINIDFIPSFDTMLAAYLLDPSRARYELDILLYEHLGANFDLKENAGAAAVALQSLMRHMRERLRDNEMEKLFFEVEVPLSVVLADMEESGFKVNPQKLKELSKEFGEKLDKLSREIYDMAGMEFNLNSPKQLGEVLFEKLSLPTVKKKKTGYSTDAEVLEKLKPAHPIIEKILDYRFLMKMKSTYADGLLAMLGESGDRIHTSFNQTVTSTGRISSTEPNLQNIPVRTEAGKRIRGVFEADGPGHVLLSGDYSQIELRVLAHVSGDDSLIDAFVKGEDIHTRTASEVFGIPPEDVTPLLRDRAKAVNFGIVYGISDFGLAQSLGISSKEAQDYIEAYFQRYPGVRDYVRETIRKARLSGYVTTIMNRRRYVPDINSRNYNLRSFAERVAMNAPIQGSAADIIKVAMVKVYRDLKKAGLKSKMLLQVHDELILDVPNHELATVLEIVRNDMENAIPLKVPLVVDFKKGYTWEEL
ncbi:MAG: DNA polymerase I [Tepidanaerobacteraceae bacterium]|jgi:DNA polymerase-1|nr:DNA polymerase I [Tepidanaerobacteraceae bacterium]